MKGFFNGARSALPIVAGYIPLGFACGVICEGVGMSLFQTVLMSLLVFAGAGQYIAAGMIGAGASPSSVIITTFIVNIRHMLYNSSLYPYIRQWPPITKAFFASEITDETFGLHSSVFASGSEPCLTEAFGINIFSHFGWIAGNFLGALSGSIIGDYKLFGFDFALPALFIALLIPKLTDKPQITAALISAAAVLVCAAAGAAYWGIIIAAAAGATAGLFLEIKKDA